MGHEVAGKSFTWILERMAMETGNVGGIAGKSLQKLKTLETQQLELLATRKLALGAKHSDTLIAVGDLARTLADQGKHAGKGDGDRGVHSNAQNVCARYISGER
jgi:hypothetical protein